MKPDTIAALATTPGVASVAIVRISGEEALPIALRLTRKNSLLPRYATLATLRTPEGEILDESLVLYFEPPKSYTTEAVVEIQCHGGTVVASRILRAVLALGARLAQPGEFTRRALLGGRIDMAQAEAIAGMIGACSDDAARLLARQLKGELSDFVQTLRSELLGMRAHAEVAIDYAEESLPLDVHGNLKVRLEQTHALLQRILEGSRRREGLLEGFGMAIIGKPNAGKSSLLNRLLMYERAIVSEHAGTTRDTIEESLILEGHRVRLVDTAGIRHAEDTVERMGIERSLAAVEDSMIVLALFDGSAPLEAEDEAILEILSTRCEGKSILVVFNKSDLPRRLFDERLESYGITTISCKGEITPLLARLSGILETQMREDTVMLTTLRQKEVVMEACTQIQQASRTLASGELEFFSYHLEEAANAIGKITAPVMHEELLDRMFGEFCLGK